ncbi:MAG: hypothetical protein ACYC8T_18395 [Myxococcaceae bacterium]
MVLSRSLFAAFAVSTLLFAGAAFAQQGALPPGALPPGMDSCEMDCNNQMAACAGKCMSQPGVEDPKNQKASTGCILKCAKPQQECTKACKARKKSRK